MCQTRYNNKIASFEEELQENPIKREAIKLHEQIANMEQKRDGTANFESIFELFLTCFRAHTTPRARFDILYLVPMLPRC